MSDSADRPLHVLVTRPEPAASRTAGHLRDLGFEASVAPLTDIQPLRPSIAIEGPHLAVATSANAFLANAPLGFSFHHIRDFICVGERTARAGVDWGLPEPVIVAPDASGLIDRAEDARLELNRWPLAYFAGRERSPKLERSFGQMGAHYRVFETYAAPAISAPFQNIKLKQMDAVLVMSPRAAELFGERWTDDHTPVAVCISPAAKDRLPSPLADLARVSPEPNFQSLLGSLVDLAGGL
ncbi:MAG: uroporphyrinogen-III synthase [Pseudomonadota bacterium]